MSDTLKRALSQWPFIGLGVLFTGLTCPLAFYAAQFKAGRLDPKKDPDVLSCLAVAAKEHPLAGFLVWLTLTTALAFWLFKPGRRELKLGSLVIGIPDAVRDAQDRASDAEDRAKTAEDIRDAAVQSVNDYATLVNLVTTLPAQRDSEFPKQVLDEICKVGALTITAGKRCRASVWLYDNQTKELRIRASHRVRPQTAENFHLKAGEGFAGQIFQSGKNRFLAEVTKATAAEVIENPNSSNPKPLTIMGLPLFNAGQVVGVLCFSHRESKEKKFDSDDLKIAEPYAALGSLVLTMLSQAGIPFP
jgi:hypothetical protein